MTSISLSSRLYIISDHMSRPQSRDLKSWFWPKCFLSKLEIFRSGVTYRWGRRSENENPERFDFAEAWFRFKVDSIIVNDSKMVFFSENAQKYNQQTKSIIYSFEKWLLNRIPNDSFYNWPIRSRVQIFRANQNVLLVSKFAYFRKLSENMIFDTWHWPKKISYVGFSRNFRFSILF